MKSQIENKIALVNNSFPSIFSKEDVVRLLNQLNDEMESEAKMPSYPQNSIFTKEVIKDLSDKISDALDNCGTDIIDDYDLSISGREVELDSISFSSYQISKEITDVIEEFIADLDLSSEDSEEDSDNDC